jgi:uncharacterized protein (DUF2062 family)
MLRLPTRQDISKVRGIGPILIPLLQDRYWRFTRRSVERGVAIGLFAAFAIPLGQMLLAAMLAVPLRANVAIAFAFSFVTNPVTFGPIAYAAYRVGRSLLNADGSPMTAEQAEEVVRGAMPIFPSVVMPTALGLMVFALCAAAGGYLVAKLFWRCRIGRRWTSRSKRKFG